MSSCNCTGQCRKTGSCSSGVSYTPQIKELTDEEIHKIAQEHFHAGLGINPLDFAKAILRKAQEK